MSFNELNPATSSLLISGDMRANFLATRRHMFSANLLQDPLLECWQVNDSTVPGTWRLTGTGATISRQTAAINRAVGQMSAQVTFGSASAILSQYILSPASYDQYFDGRVFTGGCFVKCSTPGIAFVRISDGATFTDSAFHTGGGAFEYLDVEHLVDPTATELEFQLRVGGAGSAIFSGPTCLFSDIKPDRFIMPPMARSTIVMARKGEIFVGEIDRFIPQRAFIIEHVQLGVTVVPVGSSILVDVNQWDGASFTSMFTGGGRPAIVAAADAGGAAPDGTYNRRCIVPSFGAVVAGGRISADIDQVGATTAGDNLNVFIRYKTWLRPEEIFAVYNMVN